MGTNVKGYKIAHFGGGGVGAFGLSGGKLLTNLIHSVGSGPGVSAGNSGSKTGAHGAVDADAFVLANGATIPMIRSRDVPKQLPTLAAALQRPADDHLAAEDLDAVQLELELMLSNVALRARVLKAEYDSLDKDEKRQDRRKLERVPPSSPPTNPSVLNGMLGIGATGTGSASGVGSPATSSGNSKRKLRDEPTGVRKKHSSMTILKQQQQQQQQLQGAISKQMKNSPMHTDDSMDYVSVPTAQQQQPQQQQQHQQQTQQPQVSKISMPRNDMPNKFWLSVEPYCMPVSHGDIRMIDDLLEQYRGPLVPPIPALGPHYSTTWAQEDMKSLQPGGARHKSQNASTMLKKGESMLEESITGPLTQRLVSALMDESLPSEQAAVGDHSNSSSNENTHSSSSNTAAAAAASAAMASGNFRSVSMLKHAVGIEQRLKKELIDSGLLDASELAGQEDIDEVLLEIKRVTAEIKAVGQFNSDELKRLRAAAIEEIRRTEIVRKLDVIDQEILETYKRMLQNRAKRKGHTNEEKQEILRLTSEQRTLSEQLERMQLSGIGLLDTKL